jgi:hypothetical protein
MAQSNNEANRTNNGLLGRLANLQDRLNIIPGMNDQGRFSWGELGRDAFRTAGNMVFPGLGSLFGRGFGNGNGGGMRFNFDQRVASPVRGVGTSIGRMFDGNPSTGFFNNPTAPWNNTPANVPEGSWDFMGPPAPNGAQSPAAPAPQQPQAADRMFSNGFGGGGGNGLRQTSIAGQAFNRSTPSHWRRAGTSGSWGSDGGGIGPWGLGDFFGSSGTIQNMHGVLK